MFKTFDYRRGRQ